MANPKNDEWIDDRLTGLSPDREWEPNAGRAFAQLHARKRQKAPKGRRWIWTTLAAGCAYFTLLLLPASHACAEQPGPCVLRVLGVARQPPQDFKEIGNADAPITLEIYLDYDCEACAAFVQDVVPRLVTQYVSTGKIRLLYRDFPTPSHSHARLAARYADAAGELGHYETAMKQLFATRTVWNSSGDVDSQIARVLPFETLTKVRERIRTDRNPIGVFAADLAMGQADHIDSVPSLVIVSDGKRQVIKDAPLSFDLLKTSLERR